MATVQFKLPIGAKRQVTIPRDCMNLLSLEEGGELLLEIVGDHAVLLPVVSIPRRDLPEELRKKFEARRGKKNSDIPLREFLGELSLKAEGQAKSSLRAATGGRKSLNLAKRRSPGD
jgi:bifunctional DNA-binding transcriptional regulator/antitoxin component of YhaV-PrlF toxin-antitoxin module